MIIDYKFYIATITIRQIRLSVCFNLTTITFSIVYINNLSTIFKQQLSHLHSILYT